VGPVRKTLTKSFRGSDPHAGRFEASLGLGVLPVAYRDLSNALITAMDFARLRPTLHGESARPISR
jgi:hypothetical protein